MPDPASELLELLFNMGQLDVETANSGTAVTITEPSVKSTTILTLNGVTPVITLPAPNNTGLRKLIVLKQDGTGSRVPSWATPSGAIQWVSGQQPVLPSAANAVAIVQLDCYDGVNWSGRLLARPATSVTGALSTVADAPAKAVLTSILTALVNAGIASNGTT